MRESLGKPVDSIREREPHGRDRRKSKKKLGDPAAWKGRVPRPKRNV
jgi:hypothetical protein